MGDIEWASFKKDLNCSSLSLGSPAPKHSHALFPSLMHAQSNVQLPGIYANHRLRCPSLEGSPGIFSVRHLANEGTVSPTQRAWAGAGEARLPLTPVMPRIHCPGQMYHRRLCWGRESNPQPWHPALALCCHWAQFSIFPSQKLSPGLRVTGTSHSPCIS